MSMLPPLRLVGGTVLRDGALQARSVAIAEGRIARGPYAEVDVSGCLVLPGIVALRCDGVAGSPAPVFPDLVATDRAAAASGVTTAWVTQPWSWEGGRHGPDAAEAALVALDAYRDRAGIDLRMQLCCDTHATDSGGRLLDAVRRHRVGNLRFRSVVHDALDLQHGDRAAFARLAAAAGIDERLYAAALRAARDRAPEVPRHLCRLAEAFDAMGVVYGSHADPDAETRERFSMIGARVAEMPQTRRVAATAKAVNDRVLLSASAVLGGKTEGAALPATEMIRAGLCDGLVAGDRLSSLPEAVWRLVDTGTLTLVRAWALVSSVPSEIQRLGDRGTIEAGRRADLVVIDAGTREVEATIAGGRLVHATESGTRRFAAVTPTRRLAAE